MSITIKKIAELAGVSTGTVDRALNNRGRVNPEVAERINNIAASFNYKPNSIAKSLSSRNKNYKIAVILHISHNLFFDDVIRGVESASKEIYDFGISVIIKRGSKFNPEIQLKLIDEALEEGANAIAIVPINDDGIKKRLNELHENNFPVFFLTALLEDTEFISYIGCNYKSVGKITAGLVNILLRPEDKLLVFSPSFHMLGHKQRADSLKDNLALQHTGILQGIFELTDNDIEDYKLTKDLFESYPDTTILICPSALSGNGIFHALRETGYYNKIKIIVYDFSEQAREGFKDNCIIASIAQSPEEQGYRIIKSIFDYMLDPSTKIKKYNYVKTQIFLKESLDELENM